MATIAKENLDERIERIKKRNEEIEKKYREAEEDRLRALKENAMVETKPPKDEDWPRSHKYDKLDFTYDVKPEKLDESDSNSKALEEQKSKRDYKKFAEGEGPPPDPAYNFLADAERDAKNEKGGGATDKKDQRQSTNQPGQNNKNKDQQQKRGGPNGGSFRGRGGKAHNPKYQKQNSQPEYEQWRNERERIDEARISRQKVGEGKWRREWDNDKSNAENEALLRPERATLGDAFNVGKKSPTHHQAAGGNVVEKRGNITVSVSQTGEVKSVKLTSAPVIGTGRVGPRQVGKQQFSIQAIEKDANKAPNSPKPQQKNIQRLTNNNHNNVNISPPIKQINRRDTAPLISNNNNTNHNATQQLPPNPIKNIKQPRKTQSPKFIPTGTAITPTTPPLIADLPPQSASELVVIDLSHKPEFAKKSVQDRLLRVRQTSVINDSAAALNSNVVTSPVTLTPPNHVNNFDLVTTAAGVVVADDPKTNCDKTNESIETAEPIAAI